MNDHTEEPRVRIHTGTSGHAVVRLDGLTCEDIEAALADAGAWVEVPDFPDVPMNARYRYERRKGLSKPKCYLVHRDDLPPTDPDAELVKAIAADLDKAWKACKSWHYEVHPAPVFQRPCPCRPRGPA